MAQTIEAGLQVAGGRPTKYKPEYVEQAAKQCRMYGATLEQLAEYFEVAISTIHEWKSSHQEFSEAIRAAKAEYDDNGVVNSLLQRALGATVKESKVLSNGEIVEVDKNFPPDATSIIFWLKNRQPEKWRDKQESGASDDLVSALSKLAENLPK